MLFMLNYDNKRSITQYCGKRNFQMEYCTFLCHCYRTSSFLKLGLRINPWVATLFSDIFLNPQAMVEDDPMSYIWFKSWHLWPWPIFHVLKMLIYEGLNESYDWKTQKKSKWSWWRLDLEFLTSKSLVGLAVEFQGQISWNYKSW